MHSYSGVLIYFRDGVDVRSRLSKPTGCRNGKTIYEASSTTSILKTALQPMLKYAPLLKRAGPISER